MKKSLSLILAIAVILASAFLLAPTEVRSEDPPLTAPTVEPYAMHEDFRGSGAFPRQEPWVLRLSTRSNTEPRIETDSTDGQIMNFDTLNRKGRARYQGFRSTTKYLQAVSGSANDKKCVMIARLRYSSQAHKIQRSLDVQFENRLDITEFPDNFHVEGFVRYTPSCLGPESEDFWNGDRGYAEFVVYAEKTVDGKTQREYLYTLRDNANYDGSVGKFAEPVAEEADLTADNWSEWSCNTSVATEKVDDVRYYAALRVVANPYSGANVDVYIDEMNFTVLPYVLGSQPSVLTERYAKITVDPTDTATDPTPQTFWVLKNDAHVDLTPYVAVPVGKTEGNGTKHNFTGWSDTLSREFTQDETIVAQYNTVLPQDIYDGGPNPDAERPDEVPGTYVQVIIDPTEKAEDPTQHVFWVNPDKTVDLTSKVTAPTGKTEANGTRYDFTGWSKDLSQQFTAKTTIVAQYDTVLPEDIYDGGTDPDAQRPDEVPGTYVQVIIDPTEKAEDPTPHVFWVNPDKTVDLTSEVTAPTGKTEANGTRYDFTGWSTSLKQQFTAKTTIVAQYDTVLPEDIYDGGTDPDAERPDVVPGTYVQVIIDPTEKAEDPTPHVFWVNPDKTVDLTSEVTAPTGKTEANGTKYVFTGWSEDLSQQFTAKTTIMAEYDKVEPTQPTTTEPQETTTEPEETTTTPEETTTKPEATTISHTVLWEDTEMVAAQVKGVESITLSQVYVDGTLLTEQAAANMGGIELVVEPKAETEIPGRIVNHQLIDGRRNYFYDIYLIKKQTGERLRDVSGTVTIKEGFEPLDDVRAFVLNAIPNSGDYELQKTPVTIQGNTATFYGPHFSYYVLSFGKGGMKVGRPPVSFRLPLPRTLSHRRVVTVPREAKVDAAKAPVIVTPIPATGDHPGATLALAALLFTAAAVGLLLKRRR